MYVARKNEAPSNVAVLQFIQKNSFAVLVCHHKGQFQSVHIPVEIEIKNDKLYISGHVAKANDIVPCIHDQAETLVIFSEPHAYISSSWYDHINVPTWNYIAVHLKGQLRCLNDEETLDSIHKMTEHYEKGRPDRFHVADMPSDMLQAHLDGLVAFEIEVKSSEANYKLSQNRNDNDYYSIIDKLSKSENMLDREIAIEMQKLKPNKIN